MAKTITHDEAGNAKWGDKDHLKVAQSRSFSSLIFELLSEKVPTDSELKVFELILNLSIDHGPETPSAIPVVEAAKAGKSISEAVSAGIMQINDTHGGAIEPAMEMLYECMKGNAKEVVGNFLKEEKKVPGFGHRIYKERDPRSDLIFDLLENSTTADFLPVIHQIQGEISLQTGKMLPINIDGAIAVVLCTFGWPSKLGKAVFIIARTPGLCGQYLNSIDN